MGTMEFDGIPLLTSFVSRCIIPKNKKGELTMFVFGFNAVNNKSGNGMLNDTIGLTLSYSF